MMPAIDDVVLNFSPSSLLLLNIILGIVMFGVALDMRLSDFRMLTALPRSALAGLTAQFVLLPAATCLLVFVTNPHPSIALGMILVAACPGGNISNFFTHFAGGNTALSVAMSAISTAFAVILTPLNLAFWGNLYPPTRQLLQAISIDPLNLAVTVFLLLGLPMALGLSIARFRPKIADRMKKPMRVFSMGFFLMFVVGALIANFENFLNYVGLVVLIVFLHNAMAISLGYLSATLLRLPEFDRRAVSLEIGIQNSGLGLVLIFDFFHGLGGMAIITAWWGIWHIISGMSLAWWWSGRIADRWQTAED